MQNLFNAFHMSNADKINKHNSSKTRIPNCILLSMHNIQALNSNIKGNSR